jgi:hypothetical protein
MIDNDLKPCYVFDGKPPDLKSMVVSCAPIVAGFLATEFGTDSLRILYSSRSVSLLARLPRRAKRRPRRRVRLCIVTEETDGPGS